MRTLALRVIWFARLSSAVEAVTAAVEVAASAAEEESLRIYASLAVGAAGGDDRNELARRIKNKLPPTWLATCWRYCIRLRYPSQACLYL